MSQDISVILSLQTAQALGKLNNFIDSATSGLRKLATEAAVAFVGIGSLRALEEATKGIIDAQEEIGHLSQKTGISIPLILSLRSASGSLGVSLESLSPSLSKFSANIYEAATQGGKLKQEFDLMRISLVGVDGYLRSTDDILRDSIKWFGSHAAGVEKARLAQDLFGRSGRELIPIFNQIRDYHGPINDESVEQAEELNQKLRDIHKSVMAMITGIVNEFLPALNTFVDRIRAFPELIANSFKDGNFPELLALMVEAGFEEAIQAIKVIWFSFWGGITSASAGQIYLALINAIITFSVKASQVLVEALFYPVAVMAAGFDYAWQAIKSGFQSVVNFMADQLEKLINRFVDAWNVSFGEAFDKQVDKINLGRLSGASPAKWEESWNAAKDAASGYGSSIVDWLQKQLEATRDILGTNKAINASDNLRLNAMDRLKVMLDAIAANHKAQVPSFAINEQIKPAINEDTLKTMRELDKIQQELFAQNSRAIEQNPFASQVEKAQQLIPLIEQQKDMVLEEYEAQRTALGNADTDDKKVAILKELVALQGQYNDLQRQQQKAQDLTSFTAQFRTVVNSIKNEWGSFAQQTANVFKNTFNTAVTSISNGITGLIMQTKTWNQALLEIENSIVTEIINAIVKMAVQWILQHTLMAVAGAAINASATAALVPIAAAQSAIWATPATLSTIASDGASADVAPGLIEIASLETLADIAGREFGGPVSRGTPYIVGEKRPELFVPAQDGFIVPSVPSSAASVASSFSSAGSGDSDRPVHVHVWGDQKRAMNEAIRNNPQFDHHIVDTMSKNSHKIVQRRI